MKLYLLCALSFAESFAGAATFSLAPVGDSKPASVKDTPVAAEANVVKVTGRGVGTDRASALKDAYRDAVERAVGLYVDAEQMAKNDEIVSDQILTQSNAYIEKCDIIKESTANGLVTVKVLTIIRKRELTKRMSDVMPPKTVNLGNAAQSFHAQLVSQGKRDADANELLKNQFKDCDPCLQLVSLSLASANARIVGKASSRDDVRVAYLFKAEIDRERYCDQFLPSFQRVLEQVSIMKPRQVRLLRIRAQELGETEEDRAMKYITAKEGYIARKCSGVYKDACLLHGIISPGGVDLQKHLVVGLKNRYTTLETKYGNRTDSFMSPSQFDKCHRSWIENDKTPFSLRLVTKFNSSFTSFTATDYVLEPSLRGIFVDWMVRIFEQKKVNYNVVFKDESEEEIAAFPLDLEKENVINLGIINLPGGGDTHVFYAAPFVGGAAGSWQFWHTFELNKNDYSRVRSMSIEFAE